MLGSTRGRFARMLALAALAAGQGGCSGDRPEAGEIASLPPAAVTLGALGQRLGRAMSPGDLTRLAARGDRVVGVLTTAERAALGSNALRFRVDRPSVVEVAVAEGAEPPFWLGDQGFRRVGSAHDADGVAFARHARTFAAGVVGLGVNALDRSSPAHYAVFVRSADGSQDVQITPIGPDPARVVAAGSAISPFEDVDRPLVDLPAEVRAGRVVLTRQADRADGALLPFGRAWKTRQPSTPRPDQVVASFGADPTRSLSFTWRTDLSTPGSQVYLFPQDQVDHPPVRPIIARGEARPIHSDGLLNDPTILRHHVVVDGLEPDTRYVYWVSDGSDRTEERCSDEFLIRTAPRVLRDYSFLYLGDAQCELERWGGLAFAAARARPDAGFWLLAGDLVDRGNERSNWDHFFLRGAGFFATIPFMPAVGNHEYLDKGPEIYRQTFDLPKNGPPGIHPNLVYSFEYADAFVAVLDSNLALYDEAAARLQADWLDRALTRTHATWKFVTFHHPIYASHPTRENPQLARAWVAVFDKHHVDLVLTGHDHAYLRSRPMRAGHPVADPGEGTVYVVAVSGEKFYGQVPRDYAAQGLTHVATYQTIDVEVASRRLRYRSFDRDGREVDALTIEKPAADRPRADVAARAE